MGSVPTVRTFQAGEIETAAYLNSLGAVLNFLLNPPACRVYQTTGTTASSASGTTLSFDTEEYDTDGIHSTTTNPSRLTPQTPGRYRIEARVAIGDNSTGDRYIGLNKNGSNLAQTEGPGDKTSGNIWRQEVITESYFNGTSDYVEAVLYQAEGVSITTATGASNATEFAIRWIGKQ